jgi:hypothetical protein
LTCEQATQPRIFQFVSQHDFGNASFAEKIVLCKLEIIT